MNEDVHIFKTTDGYEIIGRLVKVRNDEVIRVQEPLEIRYRVSPATGASVAVLVPYVVFGTDNYIDLFRTALVCIYRTTDEYAKTYDESLKSINEQLKSSKIETPKTKSEDKVKAAIEVILANNTVH